MSVSDRAVQEILGCYFPVLDHGFVSLVDVMGDDQAVEQAARVSYGAGTRKTSQTRGLLRYLMRHRHTTPFEMVELKFHVGMPMFVARQWIRHRTANVNEYSGRYSLMPLIFYEPDRWRRQSKGNRQGSAEAGFTDREEGYFEHETRVLRMRASEHYAWLTEHDVARELARIDLPLSTYTYWYWKIDLHNLFHFLTLRCDPHAQEEIRAYADVMAGMVKRVAPLAHEAWVDYALMGERFSRQEMAVLRYFLVANPQGDHLWTHPGSRHQALEGEEIERRFALSAREVRELLARFDPDAPREPPDHDLDLSRARDASHFEAKIEAASPETEDSP